MRRKIVFLRGRRLGRTLAFRTEAALSDPPEMRRVRPDDYEPWLAEKIERGEVEPPDEFVIEDKSAPSREDGL